MPRKTDYPAAVARLLSDGRPRTWREIAEEMRVPLFDLLAATADCPARTPKPRASRAAMRRGKDGDERVPLMAVSLGVRAVRCRAIADMAGQSVTLPDLCKRLDCSEATARAALRMARRAGLVTYADVRRRVAVCAREDWRRTMAGKRASRRDNVATAALESLEASGEVSGQRSEVFGRADSSALLSWLERHGLVTVTALPDLIQIRAA